MRLSTKGRFAVNVMIDVALHEEHGPAPLTEVSARQRISISYLEQLFSKLRQQGLVSSIRGPGGGYVLGRRMDGITVADIINAVETGSSRSKPHDTGPQQDLTQALWDFVNANVLHYMQSVTLQSLVLQQQASGLAIEQKPPLNRGVFKQLMPPCVQPGVPNSVFALGQTFQVP